MQPTEFNSPITAAYEFLFALPIDSQGKFAMAASSKGDDYVRTQTFVPNVEKYKIEGDKVGRKIPQGVDAEMLNINVEPFIQDIDDDVLDDRLENCALHRIEEYECLFKELIGDEYIERPKFRINDYWTPDVDNNEFNELASDYLDEAARIYAKK